MMCFESLTDRTTCVSAMLSSVYKLSMYTRRLCMFEMHLTFLKFKQIKTWWWNLLSMSLLHFCFFKYCQLCVCQYYIQWSTKRDKCTICKLWFTVSGTSLKHTHTHTHTHTKQQQQKTKTKTTATGNCSLHLFFTWLINSPSRKVYN